jgi:peroxiredoxin Q/BCP
MIAGEIAPDFTLYDHTGRIRSLSELVADGPVVLFFFPLASSPICTAEACHFRELGREFKALGAQRVGISTDTVAKQARFATQRAFDYPLLSDTRAAVAEQFGVRRGFLARIGQALMRRQEARHGRHARRDFVTRLLLASKRSTFVIDTDRTVLKVVSSELRASIHADLALKFLRDQKRPKLSQLVPAQRTQNGERVKPVRVRVTLDGLRGGTS